MPAVLKNPWNRRNELGLFPAFFQSVKMLMSQPREFFASLVVEPSFFGPVVFLGVFYILFAGISAVMIAGFPDLYLRKNENMQVPWLFLPLWPAFIILLSFPSALVAHWGAKALRGKGSYRDTYSVCVFSSVSGLLGLFPGANIVVSLILSLLGFVWSAVLTVLGFEKVHNFSRSQAVKAFWVGCLYGGLAMFVVAILGLLISFVLFAVGGVCPVMR